MYSFWMHPFTLCELTSLTVCLAQHFILAGTRLTDQIEHRAERRRLNITINRDEDIGFLTVLVLELWQLNPPLHVAILIFNSKALWKISSTSIWLHMFLRSVKSL